MSIPEHSPIPGRKPIRRPYYLSLQPLILWTQTRRPIDWDGQFGRTAPLEVEIGYGNGEYLVRRALDQPEKNFIGLELAWASTKRALRRLAKNKVDNVRLLQADARLALERLFPPLSINEGCCLFPAPWPKERHVRRRLFSEAFLRLLNSRLKDRGRFRIITDFFPLVEWTMTQVPGAGLTAKWQHTTKSYQTKYQRKWRENGQDVFYEMILEKQEHFFLPLVEDTALFSVRLKHFDPDKFSPRDVTGPITVKFKEILYDPQRQKALVLALVVEDKLNQGVWIRISKEDDYWLLGLASGHNILPTEGVKRALELAFSAAG